MEIRNDDGSLAVSPIAPCMVTEPVDNLNHRSQHDPVWLRGVRSGNPAYRTLFGWHAHLARMAAYMEKEAPALAEQIERYEAAKAEMNKPKDKPEAAGDDLAGSDAFPG